MNQIDEIQSRCRRIETHIYRISERLDVDIPTHKDKVEVLNFDRVSVKGHDVTLSQIKAALIEAGKFEVDELVGVWNGDVLIAKVSFAE